MTHALTRATFGIALATLCLGTAAVAEPDKPKPKEDQAIAASQDQAALASNPAGNGEQKSILIGLLHGTDTKKAAAKTAKHPGGSNKDQFAPYNADHKPGEKQQ